MVKLHQYSAIQRRRWYLLNYVKMISVRFTKLNEVEQHFKHVHFNFAARTRAFSSNLFLFFTENFFIELENFQVIFFKYVRRTSTLLKVFISRLWNFDYCPCFWLSKSGLGILFKEEFFIKLISFEYNRRRDATRRYFWKGFVLWQSYEIRADCLKFYGAKRIATSRRW